LHLRRLASNTATLSRLSLLGIYPRLCAWNFSAPWKNGKCGSYSLTKSHYLASILTYYHSYHKHLACGTCLRLRPRTYFHKSQIYWNQSCSNRFSFKSSSFPEYWNPPESWNYLRECLDCRTPSREEFPYETVTGEKVAPCKRCRKWQQHGRWCLRCSTCFSCLDIQFPGWLDVRETHFHPREPPCPICWPTRLTAKGEVVENGRPHSIFNMDKGEFTRYGSKLLSL
jgi:hypothetical protein